jgi:hypothetical protein
MAKWSYVSLFNVPGNKSHDLGMSQAGNFDFSARMSPPFGIFLL